MKKYICIDITFVVDNILTRNIDVFDTGLFVRKPLEPTKSSSTQRTKMFALFLTLLPGLWLLLTTMSSLASTNSTTLYFAY